MRNFLHLALALLALGLCGCNAVISKRPAGEKPVAINAKDWEGNWRTSDGTVKVKAVDPGKGLLKVFWIEDENSNNPVLKTADVEIRQSGGWFFASTMEESEKRRGYVWGRIKNDKGQIILWAPDDKAFKRLVSNGTFPGKLEGDDVLLDELTPQQWNTILSGEKGVLFSWDAPEIFIRQ
jgi:hypothetical protein